MTPEISTEELQKLLAGQAKPLALLDTRPKSQFDLAHIPGAINIEEKERVLELMGRGVEERIAQDYPDKTTVIIVYCNGLY